MLNTTGEIFPDDDPLPQIDDIDTTSEEDAQPIDIEEEKKPRKPLSMISIFLIILTIILCLTAIIFAIIFRVQEHNLEENLNPLEYVSLTEYNKIKLGMTYAQVKEIIGADGQLKFRTDYNGSKVEFYEWFGKNTADSKVDIIFENELVTDKKQFGLK